MFCLIEFRLKYLFNPAGTIPVSVVREGSAVNTLGVGTCISRLIHTNILLICINYFKCSLQFAILTLAEGLYR